MPEAPTVRDYSYKSLVVNSDPEHYEADDCYEFSNGRKFKSTDGSSESGIYE
jgi:hypothetical protein